MRIFFVDPNNSTPQVNYPLLEGIEYDESIKITFLTSYNRWNSEHYNKNYRLNSRYIFFKYANKISNQKIRQALKVFFYPFNILYLYILIFKYKPAILHFNNVTIPLIDYIFFRSLKVFGCKIILTQHNYIAHSHKNVSVIKLKTYKVVDKIICLSSYTKNQFPRNLKHKITFIPHGNTYEREIQNYVSQKRKLKNGNHYFRILFIGLIRPYKGIELLIEGFLLLPEKYKKIIRVEIIGNAHNLRYLAELRNKASSHKNISIINKFVNYEEMISLIDKSNAGVLPYITATQSGIPYLFARLFKPLIVTNVGALKEQVDESFSECCEPNSTSISKAIISLYSRMIEKSINDKSFVEFNKSNHLSLIVEKYIDLYNNILIGC